MGLALCRKFGQEGFAIAMVARSAEKLDSYAAELAHEGISAKGFTADIANATALTHALQQAAESMGTPEVLIYNASVLNAALPTRIPIAQFESDFSINVTGALIAAQTVVPAMKSAGKGCILITGGGSALNPMAQMASLSIGKAGIRSLALSMAQELEPAGIHVATVTIAGMIKPGTKFDPATIAEEYWQLYLESPGQFTQELVYK